MIESYLSQRKKDWGFYPEQDKYPNVGSTQDLKLSICKQTLELVNNARDANDWVKLIYNLYDYETSEKHKNKQSAQGWLKRPSDLLKQLLCALRSYVIQEVQTETTYYTEGNRIRSTLSTFETKEVYLRNRLSIDGKISSSEISVNNAYIRLLNNQLTALTTYNISCENFYNTYICDRSGNSSDQTFAEFKLSARQDRQETPLCKYLLVKIAEEHGMQAPRFRVFESPAPQRKFR